MHSSARRASWQRTDCPTWCVVNHHDDDHIHDHRHQSEFLEIPVLAVTEGHGGHLGGRDNWNATELVICLQLRDGADHTEVYIGDGMEQRIAVDVPSALRLADNLGSLVRALTASWSRETGVTDQSRPGG
ncbi:hypothetical protein GCM10010401_17410 [Rarobacter faecitabidus]|uniref:Uncharacterized protein n=1 Tax=Rarobacter faecitabidus TaxID=13243 RepID=A0A542ZWX9_RARFA|nr:hypothetical protein [Rarobacter faecitabidus]TQL64861.1 hypothetical protein FB461_1387 [Rarobacter faecitabidus]